MGYFRNLTNAELWSACSELKEIEKKNHPKNKENWPIKHGSYFSKAVDYYDHFVSMPVTVAVSELKFEVERRGIINDCKRV